MVNLSHLIIPGIGFIKAISNEIDSISQLRNELKKFHDSGKPMLGICLGMQLLGFGSEEDDKSKCLKFLSYVTQDLSRYVSKYPVPHIGWNQVNFSTDCILFDGIENGADFYFSHSFAVMDSEYSVATTNYELDFVSAIRLNNVFGVQFHPERSQTVGKRLLKNFVEFA